MTIKDTIKNSGRYGDICEIFLRIAFTNDSTKPIIATADLDNKSVLFRVDTEKIRDGVAAYLKFIDMDESKLFDSDIDSNILFSLSAFIHSELEIYMHNYAVVCSYGKQPDESELDRIRVYLVLESSISHIMNPCYDDGDYVLFDIPDEWKKK